MKQQSQRGRDIAEGQGLTLGAQSGPERKPTRREKPTTRVLSFLAAQMQSGDFAAGDQLPTERDIAARLGVSRAAVREAMTVLFTEGRIVREVGRGTFVAAADLTREGAGTGTAKSSPAKIIEARLALEPELAALAVVNGTPTDLRAIEDASSALAHATDAVEFEARDEDFHRAVAAATQNPILVMLYESIAEARRDPDWQKIKANRFMDRPQRRHEVRGEHEELIARLRDRDPAGARDAMRRHLVSVRSNILGY